jgi:hypothetical protein
MYRLHSYARPDSAHRRGADSGYDAIEHDF